MTIRVVADSIIRELQCNEELSRDELYARVRRDGKVSLDEFDRALEMLKAKAFFVKKVGSIYRTTDYYRAVWTSVPLQCAYSVGI